jgi:hypothetical protein
MINVGEIIFLTVAYLKASSSNANNYQKMTLAIPGTGKI